jgi:hypothetical protein
MIFKFQEIVARVILGLAQNRCQDQLTAREQKNITYFVLTDKLSHNFYGHIKREGHLQ